MVSLGYQELAPSSSCDPYATAALSRGASFQQHGLQKTVQMMVAEHRRSQHDEEDRMAGEDIPQPNDKKLKHKDNDDEGFTRSISLYWHWVRCQRAAARLGKGLNRNSTALILQCEHWLEAADPKHRYGTNLRPYFDYWLNQQAKARDAATARHTYIPYSAIPEIAAQAAAEAQLKPQGSNNSSPAAEALADAADTAVQASSGCSATSAASNTAAGASGASEQQHAPPATPRRSRSAPNLADVLNLLKDSSQTAAAAEDDALQEDESVRHLLRTPASVPASSSSSLAAAASAVAATAASSSATKQRPAIVETRAASMNIGTPTLPGIHTDDRFFYWLDEGAGRLVDLADRAVPRSKLESERVQYLTESERNQLEVTIDASTGLLVYKISGQTVHTGSELALVKLRASAAAATAARDSSIAAAAAAAAAVAASGSRQACIAGLAHIPEAAAEEEEEGDEQHEQYDLDAIISEQPPSQQKQRWQQQEAALQQMQEQIRCPQQQQRRRSLSQEQQQQQQQQGLQDMAGTATPRQSDTDTVMTDAGCDPAAAADAVVCCTPSRLSPSAAGAITAAAATPTALCYGAVAGHETPGTTGMSQRRWPATAAAEQQQQQHNHIDQQQQQQQIGPPNSRSAAGLLQIKESPSKWIYVLDTSGRLFVHAKHRGKFHHSSFLQGGAVLSAGGIVVEHGHILKLTADSGHYRPNFESFMGTVQMLKDWGADLTQTKLSAKHIKCPQLPEVPPN